MRLPRAAVLVVDRLEEDGVLEEAHDSEELIERVAALDIGKAELVCCARVPSPDRPGRRLQEVQTYSTMTRSLLVLADRLRELGVTRVVMEATSDLLEARLLFAGGEWVPDVAGQCPRCQAPAGSAQDRPAGRGVAVQGRRAADAAAQLRPAPGDPAVAGPDPLPCRSGGGADRGEAAGGEVAGWTPRSSWAWSPATSSGSRAGPCWPRWSPGARPKVLAQLARTRLRAKRGLLEEAFVGRCSDHHAFLLATMLGRIDQASTDIAAVEAKIEEAIVPFAQAVDQLDEICGVGQAAAQVIIAEIGIDMGRFPTPGHLVSWARFAPG